MLGRGIGAALHGKEIATEVFQQHRQLCQWTAGAMCCGLRAAGAPGRSSRSRGCSRSRRPQRCSFTPTRTPVSHLRRGPARCAASGPARNAARPRASIACRPLPVRLRLSFSASSAAASAHTYPGRLRASMACRPFPSASAATATAASSSATSYSAHTHPCRHPGPGAGRDACVQRRWFPSAAPGHRGCRAALRARNGKRTRQR
jgi:hypothetical protein